MTFVQCSILFNKCDVLDKVQQDVSNDDRQLMITQAHRILRPNEPNALNLNTLGQNQHQGNQCLRRVDLLQLISSIYVRLPTTLPFHKQ